MAKERKKGWALFSGIGGIECAMASVGIDPVLGVEHDPDDPKLSEAFCDIHAQNGWHGTRRQTVQDFALWGFPGLPFEADIAHISPVCADYSAAKIGLATKDNMDMAMSSMAAIGAGMPLNFTLEQVPLYRHSAEFDYIRERAIGLGYEFRSGVLNIGAPFGQSRSRLIAVASRVTSWKLPIQPAAVSWYKLIEDLIPAFEPIEPTDRQRAAVALWYEQNPALVNNPLPLYVERVTSSKNPKARGHFELIPTLLKSKFRDGSQNGRSKVSCLYFPHERGDRQWLNLTLEAYSRLSGFPPTFRYPNNCNVVGSGFGYAVPPLWYARLLKTNSYLFPNL
jgi:site-specific DNA-cytosine methylase